MEKLSPPDTAATAAATTTVSATSAEPSDKARAGKKPARKPGGSPGRHAPRGRDPHPLLNKLADWHPRLFGTRFLPLKVGVFEELLQAHPELAKEELKSAIAWHARSTPYLEAVAVATHRHDLDGTAVAELAPEHRHHAVMEVFRRRQHRTAKDLRPWLIERLVQAIEASGLEREAYLERVRTTDPVALQALDDAFASIGEKAAKRIAVKRAYEASGKSVEEFAQMYGLDPDTVREAIG